VDHRACDAAATIGDLERLQFVREGAWASYTNRKGESNTLTAAIPGGHLDLIAWAVSDGCPFDTYFSRFVGTCAEKGQLDILRWATDHGGCPWVDSYDSSNGMPAGDSRPRVLIDALRAAVGNGHMEMVTWLLDERAPDIMPEMMTTNLPDQLTEKAAKAGHLPLLLMLLASGFPCHFRQAEAELRHDLQVRHSAACQEHDATRTRKQATLDWLTEQLAEERAAEQRWKEERSVARAGQGFRAIVAAVSRHNEQRDPAMRRLATCARACVLEASDLPAPLVCEVRVLKDSLASYMSAGDLAWVAWWMHGRLDVSDDSDDSGDEDAQPSLDDSVAVEWLDVLASKWEDHVAAAMAGEHAELQKEREEDRYVDDAVLERARELTTRKAVMEHIAKAACAHLREHRGTTGFDGLHEKMLREMRSFGVRRAILDPREWGGASLWHL